MRITLAASILFCVLFSWSSPAFSLSWQTSCGVDSGSIQRSGKSYIFRTSKNHCTGGIFSQRSEISSSNISVGSKASYVFTSRLSMKTASREPFVIFQIHDGRNGCAPPLMVRWTGGNTLSFDSDFTKGKGMAGCVQNAKLRGASYRGPTLKRDGTPVDVSFLVVFDGDGGFDVTGKINGKPAINGTYTPSADASFVRSKRFYFKHGVYSRQVWPYEMMSTGMAVSRVN